MSEQKKQPHKMETGTDATSYLLLKFLLGDSREKAEVTIDIKGSAVEVTAMLAVIFTKNPEVKKAALAAIEAIS